MMRRLPVAVGVLFLAACTAAPSPAAGEPSPRWVLTLAQQGSAIVTGAVVDTTGLVSDVVVLRPEDVVRLSDADYQRSQQTNIIVRPMPDSDHGFLVDWAFGVCDPHQRLVLSRVGSTWNAAVDLGPVAPGPCDLVLLSTELRVTTTTSVDVHDATATMAPRSTMAPGP